MKNLAMKAGFLFFFISAVVLSSAIFLIAFGKDSMVPTVASITVCCFVIGLLLLLGGAMYEWQKKKPMNNHYIGEDVYILGHKWGENHWVLTKDQFEQMQETRDFKNGEIVYKAQVYRKY